MEYKSGWTAGPTCRMPFSDNPLDDLALLSKTTLVLVVVFVFLINAWCGRKYHSCLCSWDFMGFMCPRSSYFFINLSYCTLRSGCFSSLRSIACCLRSAEARRSKLLGIHLYWKSNYKSSIGLLDSIGNEVLFTGLFHCCHGGLLHGFHFPEGV